MEPLRSHWAVRNWRRPAKNGHTPVVKPQMSSLLVDQFVLDPRHHVTQLYSVLPPYIETYTREGNTVTIDFDSQADLTYYAEVAADRRFSEIIETLPIN